ncbi:MAG: riboflavin kinase [Hespellia sp.]|nr:riboflavin kinase [Hespellia sp.]
MKEKNNLTPLYQIEGIVIHGRGIGKLVGMPTANLQIAQKNKLPETGVYISKIELDTKILYGITHIGTRPTVDNDSDISIETHIINFNKDLYGCNMNVQLFSKIRDPRKFTDLSALLEQIRNDCFVAQNFWGIKPADFGLTIDIKTHQVKLNDKEVYLSAKEFDILYLLFLNPDIAFTKKQIYEAVWHEPANNSYHAVENTIFQVRKKFKTCSPKHNFIKTIVGFGYKYNAEQKTYTY